MLHHKHVSTIKFTESRVRMHFTYTKYMCAVDLSGSSEDDEGSSASEVGSSEDEKDDDEGVDNVGDNPLELRFLSKEVPNEALRGAAKESALFTLTDLEHFRKAVQYFPSSTIRP